MSTLKVNTITNYAGTGAPTFSNGANVTGVITATTFSGTASTAQGLTGNPIISVSGLNNSGVSTLTDTRIRSVGERTTLVDGNTATIAYNTGGGNIAICTSATGNITLAVNGIPTDSSFDNTSLTFSVFVRQTGTARSCTAVTLNGVTENIFWAGGSLASAISGVTTTSGYDIYNFVGINTVGSASTTANYIVLGVVNGGFR